LPPPDSTEAKGAASASGFKAFPATLTRHEFVGLAFSPAVRKLVLRRANHVDMYLSFKKAVTTGAFIRQNTSDMRVTVVKHELVVFLQQIEGENSCVDAARRHSTELYGGHDWHSVDYDTLVDQATMPAVLQGVLNHILPASMHKKSPPRVEGVPYPKQDVGRRNDSITNFRELCAQLRPQLPRYYDMLMEGLDPSACAAVPGGRGLSQQTAARSIRPRS
jgi:hypothetical protein